MKKETNDQHSEKQKIFDDYAKSLGCMDFKNLLLWHSVDNKTPIEHVFIACDLVQEELQKRVKEKLSIIK